MKLGRIQQVPLREIWKHEATNFTNWLALPDNMTLLSDEIEIELSLLETERNVGRFSVDIYAEDVATNRKVIIENQLERTDHDHLGKLITYASGLDAEIIIWIVKNALDEHQQAIDWLNDNTDERINFFIIRMEVWRIGDSMPAPKFHIVAQPNDWAKSVKQSIKQGGLTPTKVLQLKFWDEFKQFVQDNEIPIKLRKTSARHWYDISLGRSDAHLSLTVNSQKNEIACEVYIPNEQELFENYSKHKVEIEANLGSLLWMELSNKKASRIKKTTTGDFTKVDQWSQYFKWMSDTAIAFQNTFSRY